MDVTPSTLAFDSQAIRAAHLALAEATVSGSVGGRVSGGIVTLTAQTTLAVSAVPFGLTPGGYPVTFAGGSINTASVGEVDLTDGALNYVVLTYTETRTDGRPAITTTNPGAALNADTRANGVTTLRCYSAANLSALPNPTADQDLDLSIVTLRRCLVLASFRGNGFATGTPNTLVSGEISQSGVTGLRPADTASGSVLRIAESPNAFTQAIHGVVIVGVNSTCPVGSGTLRWNGSTRQLSWAAPDGAGGTESYGTSGTVTDTTSFLNLASATSGREISVWVYPAILYATAATVTDTIAVLDLHGDDIGAYLSAQDRVHRRLRGSAMPSRQNPHALGVENMGGVALVPQAQQSGDALSGTPELGAVPRDTVRASNATGTQHATHVYQAETRIPSSGVNPEFLQEWTSARAVGRVIGATRDPATGLWQLQNAGQRAWRVVQGNNPSPGVGSPSGLRIQTQTAAGGWTDAEWLDVADFTQATNQPFLTLAGGFTDITGGAPIAALNQARINAPHPHTNANYKTVILDTPDGDSGTTINAGGQLLRGHDDSGTPTPYANSTFEFIHNCTYNNTSLSTPWAFRDSARDAVRYVFGQRQLLVQRRAAGAASPWANADWTTHSTVDLASGLASFSSISSGTHLMPGVTHTKSIPPTKADSYVSGSGIPTGGAHSLFTDVGGTGTVHGVSASSMTFPRLPGASSNGAALTWGVELPDGAVVTGISFNLVGTGTFAGNLIGFYVKNVADNAWNSAVGNNLVFSAVNGAFTASITPLAAPVTVDNTNHTYYVRLYNNGNSSDYLSVHSIRVLYTFGPTVGIRGA